MNQNLTHTDAWGQRVRSEQFTKPAARLLWLVDASLLSIVCAAPFVFGGRHDLGRLVLVSLIAVAAVAWFARQALIASGQWHRSVAQVILLLAIGLVLLQIVPLPTSWIPRLAPRTAELLPMWAGGVERIASHGNSEPMRLGQWRTLSLAPHETAKSLAMLIAYSLLFVVVSQRIGGVADVRRLVRWIALSGVLMAMFGLVQYFTSDGRFFWFFEHPFRKTTSYVTGSFINRNHFASFLVLAVGPLIAWLVEALRPPAAPTRKSAKWTSRDRVTALALSGALTLLILAILWSLSRGGAVALLVAAAVVAAVYWYRRLVDGRYGYALVLLALTMIGLLSLYGYEDVARRLDDFAEGSIDAIDYDDARRKIWTANIAAIEAGWLTGAGAGSHRDIYPVYLNEMHPNEYTHAENGFLQVATETGIVGVALLLGGIVTCAVWCVTCLRRLQSPTEILYFGACAAGLAASVVHSAFDFIWYIPACMSVTVVLSACVLRLAQLSYAEVPLAPPVFDVAEGTGGASGTRTGSGRSSGTQSEKSASLFQPGLARARWIELAAAATLVGLWMIHTYVGPAIAAIHWDRYLRASVADHALSRQLLNDFVSGNEMSTRAMRRKLSGSMLDELRGAVAWDSQFARAHERLADRLMTHFELQVLTSDNILDVAQIRETVLASPFATNDELRAWLERAFGPAAEYLDEALFHARRAVELCPLCGEGYLYLADLCFLEGAPREVVRAYVDQGVAVRPFDKSVLVRAGRHELFLDPESAIEHWSKCFNMPGPHQQEIIYRLIASQMPAIEFVARFQPDWHSLREIWSQYRARGTPADLDALVAYAAEVTARQTSGNEQKLPPDYIWFWQASMYRDLGRSAEALACLEQAHAANPRQFHVRQALARALLEAERYAEAEPHARWCLARRPSEKSLAAALATIAKQRFAERAHVPTEARRTGGGSAAVIQATYQERFAR